MMCLIWWDKTIIDGINRKLPSSTILYTQLHLPEQSWSIVFEFSIPPSLQGYECIADKVYFLVESAPHEILKAGFEFDFLDGRRKIGKCIITSE